LRNIFFMETLSATDWSYPGLGENFVPDCFYQVGNTIEQKINALHAYRNVMRDFPHPRSEEIVKSLAAYRGGQSKMRYAEAFQTAFRDLSENEKW
jgi:N-acetylglucosamine malate deacetylase 1